jgi:pimeloyl-[acyl-carrier protein] methyl ester esterase
VLLLRTNYSLVTPPTLVLLPGLDGTGDLFAPLTEGLPKSLSTRVVRYETDCCSYTDCVIAARSALPVDQPFVLLGESFSGPVAAALAAESPAGLIGLIFCASFIRSPSSLLTALKPLVEFGPAIRPPAMLMAAFLLGRFETPELRERMIQTIERVPAATLENRLLAETHAARRIQVPCVYLEASDDRLVSASSVREVTAAVPHLQTQKINGPHFLLQANPVDSAAAILAFVDSLVGLTPAS